MHRTTNTRVGGHIAGVTAHMSCACVSKARKLFLYALQEHVEWLRAISRIVVVVVVVVVVKT
jgi:hypothetical protein